MPHAFDGYRVLMTLGEGPRSQVCLGHDTVLDRPVVIRFLNLASSDSSTCEHFFAEARAAARIQHPNVMTVYRVGEVGGRSYLIRSTCRVSCSAPSTNRCPSAARCTAPWAWRGLAVAAHRRGIPAPRFKLQQCRSPTRVRSSCSTLAWSIFWTRSRGGGSLVSSSHPSAGRRAPAKLAPAAGRQPVPGRYRGIPRPRVPPREPDAHRRRLRAGVVLYELCTGAPTGQGSHESQRSLNQRLPELDPRFASIIERCLASEPGDRFTNGGEVVDALELLAPWATADTLPEGNPYRGLLPFEAEHRGSFFGRRAEIGTLMDRLRTEAAILVAAESGHIGKSSPVAPACCRWSVKADWRVTLAGGIDGPGAPSLRP